MAALQAVKQFRLREVASLVSTDQKLALSRTKVLNPFLPHKNPDTQRWAPPKYSLRRQAELIKLARASNTLHLLPPGPKLGPSALQSLTAGSSGVSSSSAPGTEEVWTQEVEWEGEIKEKAVPGADVGNRLYAAKRRMFKGHKWERTKEKREETRKMLMKGMKQRIERFKTTYRRKAPSPISVPRTTSYTKLPF
ncbi:hypothetical protein POSPLADRAFT_1070424 [Postia placenta MAD-698-R-SB12]|uniref:Large ribosomal subunit protein mL59 domain-containing protein n=1 Tax=Postia placenta MAD-698-R-SB12 TaxID=670580 RepID=A0A1X6MWX5_9APHY|nr:hypothetical protein POSPLADRAFT_1070424 [Postia placenta MAD-698-R-SB12]OSX60875.1 hypothetical protein POSPLADRAFT_1070424 [Postia placenta MAD-698-R-SB12]